ncbi:MAG TPA: 5'-3' exonuclease H3TH domain-containing protein [Polyangiaceae bacterium]|nr:5'-3' exonuclease H3TH domain-containing protein [Polyangiaceae bacterium]
MKVHLVDGTYELFRAFYGAPSAVAANGREVGATRAIMRSLLGLLGETDVTHMAVAFDTIIESFRNELYAGYKTGDGIDPALKSQFELAERATAALGVVVWGMIEFEADDAIATGARRFADDAQVVICSPDKDLAQCVRGERVVIVDRMRKKLYDEPGVIAKYGVSPVSIPDWLALVGDSADGYPGIPKWGAKSAALVLSRYGHLSDIPDDEGTWEVKVRSAAALAESLRKHRGEAELYRVLATLRGDVPLSERLADLEWKGARRSELQAICAEIGLPEFVDRVPKFMD